MGKIQKRLRPLLGTFVEIGAPAEEEQFAGASGFAFETILKVQNLLSFHDPKSQLSKLNQSFQQEIILDPVAVVALRLGRSMTQVTGGLFDFTLADEMVHKKYLPDHGGPLVADGASVQNLKIHGCKVFLQAPLRITLDGIAKGYAVDLAVKTLKAYGLKKGYVNAGGDLRVFGDWLFPIHRRNLLDQLEFLGDFKNTSVSTSAVREMDDQRFAGKIISRKGLHGPPQSGVFSVQAPSAWLSDALTKVVCIASGDQAQKLVDLLGAKIIGSVGTVE